MYKFTFGKVIKELAESVSNHIVTMKQTTKNQTNQHGQNIMTGGNVHNIYSTSGNISLTGRCTNQ